MVREEKSVRSKVTHKILILVVKYIPMLISIFYILNTILCWVNIDTPVISNIAGVSLLTWVFLYLSSIVSQFCIYHRMFLYYILVTDLINIYDFYFGIPISTIQLLSVHSVIICILLFLLLYTHIKNYDKSSKGAIIKDNR